MTAFTLLSLASFFLRLPPSLRTLLSLQLDLVLGHTFGVFFDAFPFWLLSAPVSLRVEVLFERGFVRTCTGLVTRLREVRQLALAEVSKGPWSLRVQRGMAMARTSLVRSLLVWLQVLQQLYRMMASAGVIFRRRGGIGTRVFLARAGL